MNGDHRVGVPAIFSKLWVCALLVSGVVCSCTGGAQDLLFETPDWTTGSDDVSLVLTGGKESGPPQSAIDLVVASLSVSTWPDLQPVKGVSTVVSTMAIPTFEPTGPTGGDGFSRIVLTLPRDLASAASWFVVSVSPVAHLYIRRREKDLLLLPDGSRGVRFSPTHSPVVSSLHVCGKDASGSVMCVDFSEPVKVEDDALSVQVGGKPCTEIYAEPVQAAFGCGQASPTFAVSFMDAAFRSVGSKRPATGRALSQMDFERRADQHGYAWYVPLSQVDP